MNKIKNLLKELHGYWKTETKEDKILIIGCFVFMVVASWFGVDVLCYILGY